MAQVGDISHSERIEQENKQNWPVVSNIMQDHGVYVTAESNRNNQDHDEADNSDHFLYWDTKPFNTGYLHFRDDNISEAGLADLKEQLKDDLN